MKISEILNLIDADASVLTQKFFQNCAYVRKDGKVLDYEDVPVKRIEAIAYDAKLDVRDGRRANTFYLHIE